MYCTDKQWVYDCLLGVFLIGEYFETVCDKKSTLQMEQRPQALFLHVLLALWIRVEHREYIGAYHYEEKNLMIRLWSEYV